MSDQREQKNQVFSEGAPSHMNVQPGIQRMSAAERMMQDFNIVVPAEVVTLPSKGVLYPPNSNLHGRLQLDIKAMTTREEDILTSTALIKKGTVITELIKSCVVDKSVDIDQLISGDRNALMIGIRCTGYGPTYKPEMKCPACGTKQVKEFDLSQLPIKELEEEPIRPGVNEFGFTLPITKAVVTFKLLTGKDEEELLVAQERKKKVMSSVVDSLVSDQIKAALVSVNNVTDRNKLAFFVDNMPGRDSLALRDKMKSVQPGIDMTQLFECENCEHSEEVQIPIGIEFFWPSAR